MQDKQIEQALGVPTKTAIFSIWKQAFISEVEVDAHQLVVVDSLVSLAPLFRPELGDGIRGQLFVSG